MSKLKTMCYMLLAFSLFTMVSCSKDDKEENNSSTSQDLTISQDYYIKVNLGGEWKLNQTNAQNWCQTGTGLCYGNINGSVNDEVDIFINHENYHYTSSNIPDLVGDTIYFDQSEDYYVAFSWGENGEVWSSLNTDEPQTNSYFYIKSVEPDGTTFGFQCFKVTGSFRCMVGNLDESMTKSVTDGVFSIRVSEENI